MLEATIQIPILCPWMKILRNEVESLRFISCRPVFEGGVSSAVVVFESECKASELSSEVGRCPNVVNCSFVKVGKKSGLGMIVSSRCPCVELGLSQNHILRITLSGDHIIMKLLLPDRNTLDYLVNRLRRSGVDCKVLQTMRPRKPDFLTPRQEAALMHAYHRGYFNYPRAHPLSKLARELGLSPSTYSELLRRGIRKAVHRLLNDEAGERPRYISPSPYPLTKISGRR